MSSINLYLEWYHHDMNIESGLYRHNKSGREYRVLETAYHSETMQQMVVYQARYDSTELGPNPVFVRPIEMWDEIVDINDVRTPRFLKI